MWLCLQVLALHIWHKYEHSLTRFYSLYAFGFLANGQYQHNFSRALNAANDAFSAPQVPKSPFTRSGSFWLTRTQHKLCSSDCVRRESHHCALQNNLTFQNQCCLLSSRMTHSGIMIYGSTYNTYHVKLWHEKAPSTWKCWPSFFLFQYWTRNDEINDKVH